LNKTVAAEEIVPSLPVHNLFINTGNYVSFSANEVFKHF